MGVEVGAARRARNQLHRKGRAGEPALVLRLQASAWVGAMPSRSPYMPHGRGGKQGLGRRNTGCRSLRSDEPAPALGLYQLLCRRWAFSCPPGPGESVRSGESGESDFGQNYNLQSRTQRRRCARPFGASSTNHELITSAVTRWPRIRWVFLASATSSAPRWSRTSAARVLSVSSAIALSMMV